MELNLHDPLPPDGRYFYRRHRRDLSLEDAGSTAGHLVFSEGGDSASDHPQVVLDSQPDDAWQGQWIAPDGRKLPLRLTRAQPAPPDADSIYLRDLRQRDPYAYLRLAGLALVKQKTGRAQGHTLRWWIEPRSGMRLFEILDGYPVDQLARINRALRDRLWRDVSGYYGCMSGLRDASDGEYTQTVTPTLLGPRLISVDVFVSYDCGGAHPDFGHDPLNLDAASGRELTLEDLLWIGPGQPPTPAVPRFPSDPPSSWANDEDGIRYRENRLAPWLHAQWLRLYPARRRDGECRYDESVWDTSIWYMTPQGIYIGPSFARVERACEANDDWSIVPWRIVREHPGRSAALLP